MQWLSLKIVFEGKWNSFPLLGFSQCSYIYWILFSHNDSQRALYMEFSNHVKQRKNKIIIFKEVNCDTKTEEMTGFFFKSAISPHWTRKRRRMAATQSWSFTALDFWDRKNHVIPLHLSPVKHHYLFQLYIARYSQYAYLLECHLSNSK